MKTINILKDEMDTADFFEFDFEALKQEKEWKNGLIGYVQQ